MNTFLINVQDVKDNSYLTDGVDDKVVKTALLNCQEQLLEPVIGSKLYDYLIAGINEGTLPIAYMNLIVQKIWKPLIHGTCYMIARNLLWRMTNSAIVQDSNTNSSAISRADLEAMRSDYESSYQHHIKKLQLYLQNNTASFPEYYEYDPDDLPASGPENAINFYYDGEDQT